MGFYIVLGAALYLWLIAAINALLLTTHEGDSWIDILMYFAWPLFAPIALYQGIKERIEWHRASKRHLARPPEFYEGLDPNAPSSEYEDEAPSMREIEIIKERSAEGRPRVGHEELGKKLFGEEDKKEK